MSKEVRASRYQGKLPRNVRYLLKTERFWTKIWTESNSNAILNYTKQFYRIFKWQSVDIFG